MENLFKFLEPYISESIPKRDVYDKFIEEYGSNIDEDVISKACNYIMDNIFHGLSILTGKSSLVVTIDKGILVIRVNFKRDIFKSKTLRDFFPKSISLYSLDRDSVINLLKVLYMIDCKIVESILYMCDYDNLIDNEQRIEIL